MTADFDMCSWKVIFPVNVLLCSDCGMLYERGAKAFGLVKVRAGRKFHITKI